MVGRTKTAVAAVLLVAAIGLGQQVSGTKDPAGQNPQQNGGLPPSPRMGRGCF